MVVLFSALLWGHSPCGDNVGGRALLCSFVGVFFGIVRRVSFSWHERAATGSLFNLVEPFQAPAVLVLIPPGGWFMLASSLSLARLEAED